MTELRNYYILNTGPFLLYRTSRIAPSPLEIVFDIFSLEEDPIIENRSRYSSWESKVLNKKRYKLL